MSSNDIEYEEPAEGGTTADGFQYDTKDDGLYITGYTGSSKTIIIPSSINSSTVIGVYNEAFANNSEIETVVLPSSILKLGLGAFRNCTGLKSFTINSDLAAGAPNSIRSILGDESNAIFYNAGSASGFEVVFANGVTIVPAYLFATGHDVDSNVYCKVNSVTIPSTVTAVGDYAFYKCYKLSTLKNGSGIQTIGKYSFASNAFINIGYEGGFPFIPALKSMGEGVFSDVTTNTKISISSNEPLAIPKRAFEGNTALKSIILGKNISSVGEEAFYNLSSVETVSISESVTKLDIGSFRNCTGLNYLTIYSDLAAGTPNSTRDTLGDESNSIFYNAGNPSSFTVEYKEGVTIIPAYFFATGHSKDSNVYCRVSRVIIPTSVKEIGTCAFNRCYKLANIDFSGAAPTFQENCFYDVTATANYPANSSSWTEEVRQNYGGTITWNPVESTYVPVESVKLNKSSVKLGYGETVQLTATVLPENATNKNVVWSSDKTEIVDVSQSGVVTAKKTAGSAVITVKTVSGNKTATCSVTVSEKSTDESNSGLDPSMKEGETEADGSINIYLIKGLSYNLSSNTIWTSNNPSVVSVSKKHVIQAKKTGEATITGGGVTYKAHVGLPSIDKKKTVLLGNTEKLNISGIDKDKYNVFWVSSNPATAAVDESGVVTGIAKGTAKITAYIGGKAYNCTVTVKDVQVIPKVPDKNSTVEFMPLQQATVKLPGNISISKGVWTSDKNDLKKPTLPNGREAKYYQNDVVQVTANGKITAIGVGKTTLTVTTPKGTNTFTVEVKEPVERVVYVNVGKSINVKYTGVKTSGNKKAGYSIASPNIASVTSAGKVTGLSYGQTVLSCSYKPFDQGGFTYKSTIYVEDPVLLLNNKDKINSGYKMTLKVGEKAYVKVNQIYQPIMWKSSKNATAFIDENGNISARKQGSASLSTTINKKKYSIALKVN